MTSLATSTSAVKFPVEYYQIHTVEESRDRLAMLTGLPKSSNAEELAEEYKKVIRKQLSRGQHIPEVRVWNPDPSEFDFPTKEQAKLMDRIAQQQHATIPIQIHNISAGPDDIGIEYRVIVSEELLLDEEEKERGIPGPEEQQGKKAIAPAAFLIGGAVFAYIGYVLMPRGSSARVAVSGALGLLGGTTAAVVASRRS